MAEVSFLFAQSCKSQTRKKGDIFNFAGALLTWYTVVFPHVSSFEKHLLSLPSVALNQPAIKQEESYKYC